MRGLTGVLSTAVVAASLASESLATTIFESATLGSTGVAMEQLGSVRGARVSDAVFEGVRFLVSETWRTTRIGGHVLARESYDSSFFGAIVALEGPADYPDSVDLSTADVLAVSHLEFPRLSAEVFGRISVTLHPGWYAIVFGSGLFGATGEGAMIANGWDIGLPTYLARQPIAGWYEPATLFGDFFNNLHFIVEGYAVPEPTASSLGAIGVFIALHRHRQSSGREKRAERK